MQRKVLVIGWDGMMYPMYQYFVREGVLPNLKRLAKNGTVNEVYSSLPAYTPTNWATMMTGAHTGTHTLLRWFVDLPEPKNAQKRVNSFIGNAVKAETVFEAVGRAGLTSVAFHYPATSPRRTKNQYVVDGFANPAYGSTPFELTPAMLYTNIPGVARSYPITIGPATNWQNLPSSIRPPLEFPILVVTKREGENRVFHAIIAARNGSEYDTVIICREKDGNTQIARVTLGKWSEWCREKFVLQGEIQETTFRFKLMELARDGSRLRLYRSQAMLVDGFCEPQELGRELVERFGPYQEHTSLAANSWGWVDIDTCLDEMEYQSQWIAQAGKYMMAEKDCSLFYCHIHTFDYVNHIHLAGIDPASPGYDSAKAEEKWEIYRKCYMHCDRMVGSILEGLPQNSVVIIASDHAAVPDRRAINMRKFLFEKGLLALKDPAKGLDRDEVPTDNIDWAKTKVFMIPGRGYDIFINAFEGSSEYLKIQDEVVRTLRTWVDEATGQCPVAIALRKKDASLLGFWGNQCGDVVFINEDGYCHGYMDEWAGIKGGAYLGDPIRFRAHHGPQLPTSRTGISSNMAFLLAGGSGIKKGYQRRADELGYIHMTSLVPLVCHLLQVEMPDQAQGSLPRDLLEAGPATMARRTDYPEWEQGTSPAGWGDRVQVQRDMFDFSDTSRQ